MSLKVKHRIDSILVQQQPRKALRMATHRRGLDALDRGYGKFRSAEEFTFREKVKAEYAHVRKTRIEPRKKGAA